MVNEMRIGHMTRIAALFVVAGVLAVLAGCAQKEDLTIQNLAPETYLAIADSVRNVTVYTQTLTWWGDDKDGEVIAFEYRWFIDPQETGCRTDTLWVRTEEKTMTFNLPVTHGTSVHRFEVRAIDDDEQHDPTSCKLRLPVSNSRPEVMIWDLAALPDTTYPSFLAKWHGSDPEGDNTIAKYLVWLDGGRQTAKEISPSDTLVSLGTEDFGGRCDTLRTLNLVAIDSGCDTSAVASYTWYVKEPTGSILLVDDLSSRAGVSEAPGDRFYRTGLDDCDTTYSVLDLQKYGGLLYAHNLAKLFSMFDLVIWYNDWNDPGKLGSPNLTFAESDLRSFVEGGGSLLLVSLAAIGSAGALKDSLWPQVLGIDSVYVRGSSTNFDCMKWTIQGNTAQDLDSLKVQSIFPGVECMLPDSAATPLYYIPPGTVGKSQTENYYVGILNQWSAGEVALLTFPLSRSDQYGNARREYCKIVNLLLH